MATTHTPWSPEKHAAWEATWRAKHAWRWRPSGGGLEPRLEPPRSEPAPVDPESSAAKRRQRSEQVVLDLELQINGRILSVRP